MKRYLIIFILMLSFLMINNCSTGPQAIDYGNDGCHFCKMTIVDKIHASQLITDKGKVFKFDATECMLDYLEDNKELATRSCLTNYYDAPTEFMSTKEATFLISKNLPSPMGANLTAFKTKKSAEKIQSEKGGKLYNWEQLKVHLKVK